MGEDEAVVTALSVPGLCCEEELRFLYKLALLAPKWKPFVDLGTYQGRTAAILSIAARNVGSYVVTIDNYIQDTLFRDQPSLSAKDHAQKVKENFVKAELWADNIIIVVGDSAVIPLDGLDQIGLLFIDSEHTREQLYRELDSWLPLLVKGGILAFHDYNEPGWGKEMRPAIDERIRDKADEWECLGVANWLIGFRRLNNP